MPQLRRATQKSRERGNVTLTASFGMMSLVGFMALALDVGLLHSRQRDMRTAADAGALAAGAESNEGTRAWSSRRHAQRPPRTDSPTEPQTSTSRSTTRPSRAPTAATLDSPT